MTIARISIEWRTIDGSGGGAGHLYLVAREAGQTNGQGYAISVGPSIPADDIWDVANGDYGFVEVNQGNGAGSALGTSSSNTIDFYSAGTTESARGTRDISSALLAANSGQTLDGIWARMTQLANQIDTEEFRYDPSLGLAPQGQGLNSNSAITSVLSLVGLDVTAVAPYTPGTTTPTTVAFPGNHSLLSGAGSDYLRGWAGDDLFLDAGGGNDIFHGGNGANLVRSDTSDGRDAVYYDGYDSIRVNTATDLSSWQVEQVLAGASFLDTLQSIETFATKDFSTTSEANFRNNGTGINFQDASKNELIAARDMFGATIGTSANITISSGTSIQFNNFGSFVGSNFNDTFNLFELVGRRFDGGEGNDTLLYNGVSPSSSSGVINGKAIYIADAYKPHHNGQDVAINIEDFKVSSGSAAYFVIEKMDNAFTVSYPGNTTLSYKNYNSKLTFDLTARLVTDANGVKDTFTNQVGIIGSNLGDTYIGNSNIGTNSIPIFSGAGNDTFSGVFAGPVYYGGGHDIVTESVQKILTMPHGVTTSNLHVSVINTRLESSDEYRSVFVSDVLVQVDGYGTITYQNLVGYSHEKNLDIYVLNRTINPTVALLLAPEGALNFGIEVSPLWAGLGPPSYRTKNDHIVFGISEKVFKSAYHGTLGADQIDLSIYSNVPKFYGYDGNDTIAGSAAANTVFGGGGNDKFTGNAGDDIFYGGEGVDTAVFNNSYASYVLAKTTEYATVTSAIGTEGSDKLYDVEIIKFSDGVYQDGKFSSSSSVTYIPTSGNDTINASAATTGVTSNLLAGNDTFTGSNYNDNVSGGDGNDIIEGKGGDDILKGDAGTDTVTYVSAAAAVTVNLATTGAQNTGGAGIDTISTFENLTGSAFNDMLTGDGGANVIDGGAGSDTIQGGAGNDTMTGGTGTDRVTFASATAAVTVNLATTAAQNTVGAGTDTISGFENLTGSNYNDTLTGDANANSIDGGAGNDTIQGGAGNDTLIGGAGTDRVTFASATAAVTVNLAATAAQNTIGAGTDTISGFENLTGSNYNDTLTGDANANSIDGGNGNDTIQGGSGNDTMMGGAGTDTLTYTAATAAVTVNLVTTAAQNTGGAGTDTISTFENLTGSAFNDTLTGDANANTIKGGAGNDTIQGGAGNDILDGEAGTDTATYAAATAAVSVNLATTTAQNTVGAGSDTITNFENLTGSGYNDTLRGSTGNNTLVGGNGNDALYGNSGNDLLYGDAGTDTLYGDAGNDTLNGGVSNDVLYGGVGSDIFKFSSGGGLDTVKDFKKTETDKIDIKDLLSGYDPATKAITDFIQITTSGAHSIVKIDANGLTGGVAWTQIAILENATGLTDELALKAAGTIIA